MIVTPCGWLSWSPAGVMRVKRVRRLHVLDRGRAAVTHRLAQPTDDLVHDRRERPLVGDAPLDPLRDELVDVLDVALEVAVLENDRAFIAPSEPIPRYSLKRSP